MNYAGVNATTNMTMECSIFYFRRLAPPPPRVSRLLSLSTSLILQSRLLRHYLFRFIPGFLRNSRSLVRWTEDQRTIVEARGTGRELQVPRTNSARSSSTLASAPAACAGGP